METKKVKLYDIPKWDRNFISICYAVKSWSKDNFKVGAVTVRDRRILTTGYNGFPFGFDDSESRIKNKSIKRKFMIHAEENCVINASRNGISLIDSTIYVSSFPCINCAKVIVQSGIKRVVCFSFDEDDPKVKRYKINDSVKLFEECGVELTVIQ